MDITCPRCGEPWDMDSLHEAVDEGLVSSFRVANRVFHTQGCGVLFEARACPEHQSVRTAAAAAMFDLLGDDVDGIAAMLDDFDYVGLLD